jgi:predicted acetyltransferase
MEFFDPTMSPWPELLAGDSVCLRLSESYAADDSPWRVPAYRFAIVHENERVGTIGLRVSTDNDLVRLAGQIGFVIDAQHRGQGLAGTAVRLLLPLARHHDICCIWFTTTNENAASRRVLEKLGAVLAEVVPIPPSYPSYATGEREKLLYRWAPAEF